MRWKREEEKEKENWAEDWDVCARVCMCGEEGFWFIADSIRRGAYRKKERVRSPDARRRSSGLGGPALQPRGKYVRAALIRKCMEQERRTRNGVCVCVCVRDVMRCDVIHTNYNRYLAKIKSVCVHRGGKVGGNDDQTMTSKGCFAPNANLTTNWLASKGKRASRRTFRLDVPRGIKKDT